jgi:putative flippase GtrA
MSRLPPLLALIAATFMLMAVAFADARPTVFYDSHSYDVMGRDLIETVRDYPASLQSKFMAHKKMGDWPVPTDRLVDPNVEGARSWFYGLLLHGTYLIGTLWLLAALQSFLAAWVIYLLWRTMAPKAPGWSYLAVVAAAVAGTSVSFFTTFAMPDIFAGIGGAAVVLILAQSDRLKRIEVLGLWAICAYSMMVHKSHWGVAIALALAGGILVKVLGLATQATVRRVLVVLSAALVASLAGMAADAAYQARTGYKLGHPPFVMARVLADGPGRDYMQYACAHGEAYTLCRYKANVGNSTDLILWSNRKKQGVFNVTNDLKVRRSLEDQEMRFVLGVLKFDPLGQARASLQDWFDQFIAFQVDDPLRNPSAYLRGRYWPTTVIPKLIPNFQACRPPGNCRPPFDSTVLEAWHGTVLAVSGLLLLWRMTRRDVRQALLRRGLKSGNDEPARLAAVVLLLLGVTVLNAAVCGILSGPFARYQSRVIWLIPVGAGLMACALPIGAPVLTTFTRRALGLGQNLWSRIQAQPVIGRFLPALNGHFIRFCVVGGLGFLVDFTVLHGVVHLGMDAVAGRWISVAAGMTATWLANRAWTFRHLAQAPQRSIIKEMLTYYAVQSVGAAANITVYTAMLLGMPALRSMLLLPMVAGTVVGLVINYLGSKHIVFRRRAGAS